MKVKIGDIVGVWDGTHLAHIKVTKLNRRTFIGVEQEKSHIPGRNWQINYDYEFTVLEKVKN